MADRIILEETQKYQDNEPLNSRILKSFPTKLNQTLYSHRKTLLGYVSGLKVFKFLFLFYTFFTFQPQKIHFHIWKDLILFLSEPKQRKRNRDARKYADYQWNIINCMVQLLKPLLKSTCQPY